MNIERAKAEDKDSVMEIVRDTEFFKSHEIDVAEEVFDDAIKQGDDGDYQSFVSKEGDNVTGWVCFGQTPCTVGTFDIYWIAVSPKYQNRGIGKLLVQYAMDRIKTSGGRMAVAETSGNPRYQSTRYFYEKIGFAKEACIKDFYAIDDDKIIYIKRI
ncbi:MAG: GNAT family N-acetyltransferase [Phycisphaerae bacterium]|nr:GNAT family N-acetyltransferase [Phycisphaerae bacterium]